MILIDLVGKQHSTIKEYEYRLKQSEIINHLIQERKEREMMLKQDVVIV